VYVGLAPDKLLPTQEILRCGPATFLTSGLATTFLLLADYGVAVTVMKELAAVFQYLMFFVILMVKCVVRTLA
jgi:hypothetical protein